MRASIIPFAATITCVSILSASEPLLQKSDVFEAGKDGYAFYRIPGLVVTSKGTVLAYCEARRSSSDWSAIDIMMRRSTDGGKTWAAREKIAEVPGPKKKNPLIVAREAVNPDEITYNNAVAIPDRNGAVHLLFCLEIHALLLSEKRQRWRDLVESPRDHRRVRRFSQILCLASAGNGTRSRDSVEEWLFARAGLDFSRDRCRRTSPVSNGDDF